jgi:hypothetical protein
MNSEPKPQTLDPNHYLELGVYNGFPSMECKKGKIAKGGLCQIILSLESSRGLDFKAEELVRPLVNNVNIKGS